jgi:di/tripeptidase
VFDGGASVNAIPVAARAKLDLRSEDPVQIEEMAAVLTASVERALAAENADASGPRLAAKIREIGSRPGGSLPESAAILHYIRSVDAYLGIRAQEQCSSTDANIPLSLGREAVSIGTGGLGGGAHTPDEWYEPEGREIGLKRIFLILSLLTRTIESHT